MKKFIPKIRQRFRAFLKNDHPGREHYASPFQCIEHDRFRVLATDSNGNVCNLSKHDFYFTPAQAPRGLKK